VTRDRPDSFAPRCLSLDLEVGRDNSRIYRFAAIRGDTGESLRFAGGDLSAALEQLDGFADGVAFLVGHNIVAFDLPHLAAANRALHLLQLPVVDTLRLNPLAFPRNPYHRLVKHYQDGQLKRVQRNDPLLDARLALDVFRDQSEALRSAHSSTPDLVCAWHWLTTVDSQVSGVNAFFATVRHAPRPSDAWAQTAIAHLLAGKACVNAARDIVPDIHEHSWSLAYALAWLSVAGGNSVMPPWVRHQFPGAGRLVHRLRNRACDDPACSWCRERHDARHELARWFGFEDYRSEPADSSGQSLQKAITTSALNRQHALGILPTGAGKSICYQVPALSSYDKTGALTIVISPLVALMADQVASLEARGITCCAALNGLLSLPERRDVLDRVRMGDIGILLVAPEQLRSRGFRRAIEQREIGAWVLDEAHCLSKWGHDFRPDYRYVGRFIKEKAADGDLPPVLCLTATARRDVIDDIVSHFRDKVGVDLAVFDGGAERRNLEFVVVNANDGEKLPYIFQIIEADLLTKGSGGAIVYCAVRRRTEEIARFLADKGVAADYFHAGLLPDRKKEVQRAFSEGALRAIVATNAFGMGIDKPDVRLVVHADIPGSLENYLQEAGRAGRDRAPARCVLLYAANDVERQFAMSARSRLDHREIVAILKALRRLDVKKPRAAQRRARGVERSEQQPELWETDSEARGVRQVAERGPEYQTSTSEVIATSGEILLEEEDGAFERDAATDDTRVRTAVSWLEEATLLSREENDVQVFPSSLRVNTLAEAEAKLAQRNLTTASRQQLLDIVAALIDAPPGEGLSTDELMAITGVGIERLRKALYDLETLGIASNDTVLTAFVHAGIERSSKKRLDEAAALEHALVVMLREAAPDLVIGDASPLHLRVVAQRLKDDGHSSALPERLLRIVRGLALDGQDEAGGMGSLSVRPLDAETVMLTLKRKWSVLEHAAQLRRSGAQRLLEHWLSTVPGGVRGADLLAETTLGELQSALQADLELKAEVRDLGKLLDRSLLWLHEMEVLRLHKGLAVFRPAMTIVLSAERRGFTRADFEPLAIHYAEQVAQIHIMDEYAARGVTSMQDALGLAKDYFQETRTAFIDRWVPHRRKELTRQTTPESWRAIVESLANATQQRIVTDDRELTNVLVLAGPGSGKTRVLVHRIAYLIRVRRQPARGILALAYNRHAASEIRERLRSLIGDDANGVVVLTCHGFAMRLTGATFQARANEVSEADFAAVLAQAAALLKGEGLPPDEADEQRDRLLQAYRWILVDEYQDVEAGQYELISALAGRTLKDENARLSLFAVGDDDQNIYSFAGASVEYVRRFESDYSAKPVYLIENYRSSAHIIAAANTLIAGSVGRMKQEHPITINDARAREAAGGRWEALDPVSRGRVQILPAGSNAMSQALAVMREFERLASLDAGWDWCRVAVIARDWRTLEPVRSYCVLNGIPVQMADENPPHFWRLRETQALLDEVSERGSLIDPEHVRDWLGRQRENPWWTLLREAFDAYRAETLNAELPVEQFREWLAEWGRDVRRRQHGLMLLTAHRAKGLEFDNVVVLDGNWDRVGEKEDPEAPRRLYYVAMTRARQTLTLARQAHGSRLVKLLRGEAFASAQQRVQLPEPPKELARRYERLSLSDVDIGFAGRQVARAAVHQSIAKLVAGDSLTLCRAGTAWELRDAGGATVGKLAKRFKTPEGMSCIDAEVNAVVVWRREWTDPKYVDAARCDQWEVVVPELVFEPQRD
jgi:ATP-dependent DNA helicase RecQ